MANISPEVVLGIFFLTLSGVDIDFLDWELWWRTYTTSKALLTIRRIEPVDKKQFVAAALNPESKTFIIHVTSLSSDASPSSFLLKLNIHPSHRIQVSDLIVKKAPIKVPGKYSDFADVFSLDLAFKLSKYTGINYHNIKLVDG